MDGTATKGCFSSCDESSVGILLYLRQLATHMRTTPVEQLNSETLTAWADDLDARVGEEENRRGEISQSLTETLPLPTPQRGSTHSGSKEPLQRGQESGLPIADNGRLGERQLTLRARMPASAMRNLSMCVLSVLEAVCAHVELESVALFVPYRGISHEFRCICRLASSTGKTTSGSGILRGSNTLEYACLQTGYIINAAPKIAVTLEKKDVECFSLLESLCGKRDGRAPVCRLCCPIKCKTKPSPIGVITIIARRNGPFEISEENFVFDAALILGTLLSRCDDNVTLQQCFSTENLTIPPPMAAACEVPYDASQLSYRTYLGAAGSNEIVRVISKESTKLLREGSPVMSVFVHMSQMVKAWNSAVKLNVELQRLCEEKEAYVTALLARIRLGEKTEALPP